MTAVEMWLLKDFKIQIAQKTWWKKVKLFILINFTFLPPFFLKAFYFNVLKLEYIEETVLIVSQEME